VEQAELNFMCPVLNDKRLLNPELPAPTDGQDGVRWRTRCKVCDLQPQTFVDQLEDVSLVGPINFEFGPNSLDGTVDELDIEEYEVWLADQCGNLLGPQPVTTVPVQGRENNKQAKPTLPQGCCSKRAYKVEIEQAYLPVGHTNVSVVIVPFTSSVQRLTIGAVAGIVVDEFVLGASSKKKAADDEGKRSFGNCMLCTVFAAFTSVFSVDV